MNRYFLIILVITFCLTGCWPVYTGDSYKYKGITKAEYGHSSTSEINITVSFNRGTGVSSDFKSELTRELLEQGFNQVSYGRDEYGYAIEIDISRKENISKVSLFFAVTTLGIFPTRADTTNVFNLSFYKGGRFIRSSRYESTQSFYFSIAPFPLYPMGALWPDTLEEVNRKMAKDLAKNIALDFPVIDH